ISTQLHVQDLLPRMGAGNETLQSVLDVFDGAAGEPGHQTGDDLLAVEVSLGSETATERGYPHPNAVQRFIEHLSDKFADAVGRLRRDPQLQLVAVPVPRGHAAPGLE